MSAQPDAETVWSNAAVQTNTAQRSLCVDVQSPETRRYLCGERGRRRRGHVFGGRGSSVEEGHAFTTPFDIPQDGLEAPRRQTSIRQSYCLPVAALLSYLPHPSRSTAARRPPFRLDSSCSATLCRLIKRPIPVAAAVPALPVAALDVAGHAQRRFLAFRAATRPD
ncbi:hypothetical protein BDU57DRAFT_361556 [Ampelomyces quisqualis]|uniref:Uncharacterized protein n=1 Tax=Ampelomyces quisqualis TaxID=50730 RepID=A0A6A5QBY8_AMPQU|nr:hypothetical protein BDU57DRAFT_361556 [Ampelomyces quisqualis]